MAKKIFVGNLPYEVDERQLSQWFMDNGFPADSVCIATDRISGEPRGFGYVEMGENVADRCIAACNGLEFLGRTLIVNEANAVYERRQALCVQKSSRFVSSSE